MKVKAALRSSVSLASAGLKYLCFLLLFDVVASKLILLDNNIHHVHG